MELRGKVAAVVAAGGSGEPSGEELGRINGYALAPLSAGEVYVRRVRLANDAVDRTWERLPRVYLERLAATLPGKPLLLSHDHGETPTGLWFEARVRRATAAEPGEWSLEAGFYLRKSGANEEIRRQIDAGVIRYASIGFRHDGVECDLCGARMGRAGVGCEHQPGGVYEGRVATFTYGGDPERVEAHEGSLVYLGAQYGAELMKELSMGRGDGATGTGAERRQGGDEATRREGEGMSADEGRLRALAEDGRAYRGWLKGELVRLAGIVRAEAEAELLVAALEGQGAAKWLPVIESFQARVDALLPPSPVGEPAAPSGALAGARRGVMLG